MPTQAPLALPLAHLPSRPLRLIVLIALVSTVAWTLAAIPLRIHPRLLAPAALSYVLGLRHGLDADHISAIDLATRRLVAAGQRPVAVGTFFSLGHSAVVVLTCVAVAATSGALREDGRFEGLRKWGAIVGSAVSAAFLIVLCCANGWVLWGLVRKLRARLEEERVDERVRFERNEGTDEDADESDGAAGLQLEGEGFLANVFRKLFKLVDSPWKMMPLGMLFGLGFDTSSEIAILGLTTIHAVEGTSIWLILIFPVLFTAGMCLVDTIDGALMMSLYTSKAFARDRIAILYYSIVLTSITVGVAAFIGIVQVFTLVQNVAAPEGAFWDWIEAVGEHFDVIGACICGIFVLVGAGSVVLYGPWRRRMERRREWEGREGEGEQEGEDEGSNERTGLLRRDTD